MSQDNVRLALWISGAWGFAIIVIVGLEALLHDGAIAATIVDTFSKVLFGLGAVLGAITGLGKLFDTQVATAASPIAATVAAAAASTEPTSDPGGITASAAVSGPGVD